MTTPKITRRAFTKSTLAAGLSAVGASAISGLAAQPREKSASGFGGKRLNVLLLLADDQGRDLSCLGTRGIATPTVDRLASEGVQFRNAFSTCASCSPSRGSILTGMYPHSNGFWRNVFAPTLGDGPEKFDRDAPPMDAVGVRPDIPTLVELLNAAGYLTGIMQKFHLSPAWKFPFHVRKPCGMAPEQHGGIAAEFFEQAGAKPFFMMANIGNTHRPFPQHIIDIDRPRVKPAELNLPDFLTDTSEMRADYAEYLDGVQCADACAAAILDALNNSGRADNTLIIYTSDHGIAYHRAKATAYPAGVAVPLVVSGPGVRSGGENDNPASLLDLMPTILDSCGIDIPSTVQGESLRPVLEARADGPSYDLVFCEHQSHGPNPNDYYPSRAATDGRYWYIHNLAPDRIYLLPDDLVHREPWKNRAYDATVAARETCPEQYELLQSTIKRPREELYDLKTDPWAMKNVATDKRHDEKLAEFRTRMERWRKETNDNTPSDIVTIRPQPHTDGSLHHAALISASWMKGEIALRFPETLQTDTLDFIDHHRDDMPPRVPSEPLSRIWGQDGLGGLTFEWNYDNQSFGGRLSPGSDFVDMAVWLKNHRKEPVSFALQFCPILRDTMFQDRTLERSWVHTGGQWRRMADTDRGDGKRALCHYPVKGGPPVHVGPPWGASGDLLDEPVVAITSDDGRRVFGLLWPRPRSVLSNSDIPCVHADPVVVACAPGKRVEVRGRLYLLTGDLDGLLNRVRKDIPLLSIDENGTGRKQP